MNERDLFLSALEIEDPAARKAHLQSACAGNGELLTLVESLLASHEGESQFLQTPVGEQLGDEPAGQIDATLVIGAGSTHDESSGGSPDASILEFSPDQERIKMADEIPLGYLEPSTKPGSLGRLAHYEILEVVGSGAFGTVLRAFDDKLQRVVAIKVMAPELASTSPARKRFIREAQASAAIRHENVVSVYAVEEKPIPYLVMEFIPGLNLQQRLDERGPLDVITVLRMGTQIAEGLAAAHAKDLIHRDIKPGNILLESGMRDRVKITDFGLARAADDASMTQSGTIAGTPMYMAPEQALGHKLDQRADLFSFGSVLYQMVSGRPPFRASSTLAVLKRLTEDTPRPIREIIPETPAWLCDIIAKLHAKNPDERYQSAREIADVLANCESQLKEHSRLKDLSLIPRAKTQPAGWWKWVAAAAVMLPLLAIGLYALTRPGSKPTVAENGNREPSSPEPTPVSAAKQETPPPAIAPFDAAQAKAHQKAWAKHLGVPVEYTNSLGMKFVLIPPGEFLMGSPAAELEQTLQGIADDPDDILKVRVRAGTPQHRVMLTQPRYLSIHEVTQAQYEQVMGKNPAHYAAMGTGKDAVAGMDTANHPVEMVSWLDAVGFCLELGKREKLKPFYLETDKSEMQQGGTGYRLPTEAEWEFACRAGTVTSYATGDQESQLVRAGWFVANSGGRTHAAGELQANPFGLHDMHGNVWEWIQDWSDYAHYQQIPKHLIVDPIGPTSSPSTERGLRGGKFDCPAFRCRSSNRDAYIPTEVGSDVGFRVSLTVDAVKATTKETPPTVSNQSPLTPTFTNGIGMEFVIVPKGKSWLGGGKDKLGDKEVEIPADFYLGKYEVTQEEWEKVMGENPSGFSRTGDERDSVKDINDADLKRFPVENVSWDQCQVFVAKLNEREKEKGWVYRLPKLTEWEYACRGGPMADKGNSPFDFCLAQPTNTLLPDQANFEHGSGLKRPCKVGSYQANGLGLLDMHGNVAEWCVDNYTSSRLKNLRGGCWFDDPGKCKLRFVGALGTEGRATILGVRLARVPSGVPSPEAKSPPIAKQDPLPPTFKNTIGMEFVIVPKGKAWLGGGKDKPGDNEVEIPADFYLGKYEVTQEEWEKVMGENPSHFSRNGEGKDAVKDIQDADLKRFPMENMSWDQCQVFVAKLNQLETENGWVYRLPTADEWEYACRGGPMANRLDSAFDFYLAEPTNTLLPEQANTKETGLDRTCKVGSYPPSRLGLFDMHGNVSEYFVNTWESPKGTHYMCRGGTFNDNSSSSRSLVFGFNRGTREVHVLNWGLRLARVPAGGDPDRTAAKYVLSSGGTVQVNGVEDRVIKVVEDLPREAFRLTMVMFTDNKQVRDAELFLFEDCKNVTHLSFEGTQVGNAGLAHFKNCKNLRLAWLGNSKVSDAGLALLKDCQDLTHLNLGGTEVGDTGLAHLKGCKNLTVLWLQGTQVTDAGLILLNDCNHLMRLILEGTKVSGQAVDELAKALPKCKIEWDGGVIEPKPLPTEFKNTLGMEFVIVPKGKSWLGGGKDKPGDKEVEIPADFYLGKYEVTQEEWEKVMGKNPSKFSRTGEGKDAVKDIPDADLKRFPVENVSWDHCQIFVAKLNELEAGTGWFYRLPTEREWEYACRGGPMADRADSAFNFYFANPTKDLLPEQANFKHDKGLNRTCKVGSYQPNMLGLYDMHGNAWEWCADTEKLADGASHRVMRGASWGHISGQGRATDRYASRTSARTNDLGLRLARVPVGVPSLEAKTPPTAVAPFTDADVKRISALPAAEQVEEVRKELMRRNPGFDGKFEHKIEAGVVTEFWIVTDHVTDISPIRVFNALRLLQCYGTWTDEANGLLENLTPLQGMNLAGVRLLGLGCTKVNDAQMVYFKGCKDLKKLYLDGTMVTDSGLANFKECKDLTHLVLVGTKVTDIGLAHFQDCKDLRYLNLSFTKVTDGGLTHFKKLAELNLSGTKVSDEGLKNLTRVPLKKLFVDGTGITDLNPLQGMPLEEIHLTPKNITRGLDILREMKSLKTIGIADDKAWPAAEFWERYDKGEFGFAPFTDTDVKRIAALPSAEQIKEVQKELVRRNRGFDGKVDHKINEAGVVTELRIITDKVTDISPIRVFHGLRVLDCSGTFSDKPNGQLADLTPLQGMNSLTHLILMQTKVTDAGMAALKNCKELKHLNLNNTTVSNTGLNLKDFPALEILDLSGTNVTDETLAQIQERKTLTHLLLGGTKVSDAGLARLKGMPLKLLWIDIPGITDLSPLQGMPLEEILLTPKNITKGLDHLRDMKSLKTIGTGWNKAWPAAEFWERYDKGEFGFAPFTDTDVKRIAALPAAEQVEEVRKELMRRNPGFDGTLKPTIENDVVTELSLNSDEIIDIAPVRALKGLIYLDCRGTYPNKGKLSDLSPLKGMTLGRLDCSSTQIADLTPLAGLPMTYLHFNHNPVSDLTPLKGMPLLALGLAETKVSDLSPLKGMKLKSLGAQLLPVTDLSPLEGMPLTGLDLYHTVGVTSLEPLKGMPLEGLNLQDVPVSDLSPLKGMTTLRNLNLQGNKVSDLTPLQGLKLTDLFLLDNQITDLSPLKGMPLVRLGIYGTGVSDLRPLQGMELAEFRLTPKNITQGLDILRGMQSLKTIGIVGDKAWPAAEFWDRYDKGEFKE